MGTCTASWFQKDDAVLHDFSDRTLRARNEIGGSALFGLEWVMRFRVRDKKKTERDRNQSADRVQRGSL
jgi:hypothetical protein